MGEGDHYHEKINIQTDFVIDLARDCDMDYPHNVDTREMFHQWEGHKHR